MQHERFIPGGVALLTLALALGACTAGEDDGRAREAETGDAPVQSLPASAQLLVDAGNLAYRGGEFETALSHFRSALQEAPAHPVPLFGVHLSATALGDSTLADSVATILREEAPWLLDMMQHPEGDAAPDPHAGMGTTADPHGGMGRTADPHAGMVMVPVPDGQADTTR
jgi:hypothetical protein